MPQMGKESGWGDCCEARICLFLATLLVPLLVPLGLMSVFTNFVINSSSFFKNLVLGSPSWLQTHRIAEASLEVLIFVPFLQSNAFTAAELSRQNYSELCWAPTHMKTSPRTATLTRALGQTKKISMLPL